MPVLLIPLLFLSVYLLSKSILVRYRRKVLRQSAINLQTLLSSTSSSSSLGSGSSINGHTVVGLFHPFCNAGGGGERVVWTAVEFMQRVSKKEKEEGKQGGLQILIYTGDWPGVAKDEILDRARSRFNIRLDPATVHFVPIRSRAMIGDSYWPRLTLLGQAWGSIICAWESLAGDRGIVPDIFIVVRLLSGSKIPIGAYVHYPTISTDMLERVRTRQATHTNTHVASSSIRSNLKLIYYRFFALLYTFALGLVGPQGVIWANSTWTKDHLVKLLGEGNDVKILYPPCETGALSALELDPGGNGQRERVILSLAQFRPEKDHPMQLHALAELFARKPNWKEKGKDQVKLVMVGSVRDEGDERRVQGLRELAQKLDLQDNLEIVVNASYQDLLGWLGRSSVGIATMVDEHFGINVVEFMSAGLIPLSHASAGPLLDIIIPYHDLPTGYHARPNNEI
ncbi:Glycosyltransferase [Phaffia rhodozyma]|uniref:GDP-Man:Man(3)GlcNAc(2)-PP-Dol alpha-1,2-mannosyltransferase n=1 Tax=Phaffia rhodozyma TaxID=264483 RepID=A0A0F7SRV8_PHARH|nr:Glycosyltransferase [Phaffia rhodozyma]